MKTLWPRRPDGGRQEGVNNDGSNGRHTALGYTIIKVRRRMARLNSM